MGCFLLFTDEDLQKTEVITSLDDAFERLAQHPGRFVEALGDETNPNHQLAMSVSLRNATHDLSQTYRDAFSDALRGLASVQKGIVGLVHNYSYRAPERNDGRNQGQTTLLNTKISPARAAEVISAEAVHRQPSAAGNGKGDTGKLFFDPVTDRLAFAQKSQARYPDRERGSIESDFQIVREVNDPLFGKDFRTIGVDVKHSKAGSYSSGGLEAQLKGVVNALLTGTVHEFHFVAKEKFDPAFKTLVEKYNAVYWNRSEPDHPVDASLIGSTLEREEHQKAMEERAAKTPKIFWHESVWLDEFR